MDMSKITKVAAAVCMLSASFFANASQQEESMEVASATAANVEVLRELRRLYSPSPFDHKSATYLDPNYFNERSLGFVSTTAFTGSRPIYLCFHRPSSPDYFTSLDFNCEGKFRGDPYGYAPHLTGFISTTQIADTAPLYRCRAGNDHFESFDGGCEGYLKEQLLGYVFVF